MKDTTCTDRKPQITIREVAALANVSQMTVSRVLNKPDSVRKVTRLRVEATIRQLGYRPNLIARSLARGSSCSIGVIYHNASDGYLGEVLVGALRGCRADGHRLFLESLKDAGREPDWQNLRERLEAVALDGVILLPPLSEAESVQEMVRALGVPAVLIAPATRSEAHSSVVIDDAEAAGAMTRHIIELGHTKIGFVSGPMGQASAKARFEGFKLAMSESGLAIKKAWIAEGDYTYRSGALAAERILSGLRATPSVIFASNDDMAAGIISTAYRLGLNVPSDLSVVGFDDTPIATSIWPQLTTVRQPIAEMAARAVSMISDGVRSTQSASPNTVRVHIEFAIVRRDSLSGATETAP